MANNSIESFTIRKCSLDGDKTEHRDLLAKEVPVEIRLASESDPESFQTLTITLCSPENLPSLAVGHLYTEGLITDVGQVRSVEPFETEFGEILEVVLSQDCKFEKHLSSRNRVSHPSCGLCGRTEIEQIFQVQYRSCPREKNFDEKWLCSIPQKVRDAQVLFQQTGAVHASALFNHNSELLALSEDIGRHNALDKLIGQGLQSGVIPDPQLVLFLSGRISFELIHKALMAQIGAVIAVGAPSSLAVELAKSQNLPVFGFVKNNSFNQYC